VPGPILYSNTSGNTPASLVNGTIGINQADGKLYYRSSAGVVTQFTAGGISDPYDLGTYPLITVSAQPSSATVTVGQSATFSVTAAATLPSATIAYQWQVSTDSGSTYSNVTGATSSSLSLTNLQTGSSGYRYRCWMTANLSQIFSSVATLTVNLSFTPVAVLLTSGTSYTVPSGASSMKAWAIGAGGGRAVNDSGGAGGCAYKTWSVSGGQSVSYGVGAISSTNNGTGGNTTVTLGGTTISGNGGSCSSVGYTTVSGTGYYANGGSYSGGDGGAAGGAAAYKVTGWGGGVGGNSNSPTVANRLRPTDVSGLFAAVSLAGGTTTETGAATGAFGTGGFSDEFSGLKNAGLGGGGAISDGGTATAGGGVVVLYFA